MTAWLAGYGGFVGGAIVGFVLSCASVCASCACTPAAPRKGGREHMMKMKTVRLSELPSFAAAVGAVAAPTVCGGWLLLLSKRERTVLTATLYPPDRPTVRGDWDCLGRICAAVGVPEGTRELGRTVETSPAGPHTWTW